MVFGRIPLGMLNVSVRIVKPGLVDEQPCQVEMNTKKEVETNEGRSDSKRCLEMVNGLLRVVLGAIYNSKKSVALVEVKIFISP